MADKEKTEKKTDNTITEIIQLIWVEEDSKEAEEMENNGHAAEIEYDSGKGTKIYLRIMKTEMPDLAHELGHYIQNRCEKNGVKFAHSEEMSNAFEDLTREILRMCLYPEYRAYKVK